MPTANAQGISFKDDPIFMNASLSEEFDIAANASANRQNQQANLKEYVQQTPANETSISPVWTPIVREETDGTSNVDFSALDTQTRWGYQTYWANPSGGQLPQKMSGEFVAVSNTFGGLQSGDVVMYLPLNVAYGTSTSNCVWFQFDIQFSAGVNTPTWYIYGIYEVQGTAKMTFDTTQLILTM